MTLLLEKDRLGITTEFAFFAEHSSIWFAGSALVPLSNLTVTWVIIVSSQTSAGCSEIREGSASMDCCSSWAKLDAAQAAHCNWAFVATILSTWDEWCTNYRSTSIIHVMEVCLGGGGGWGGGGALKMSKSMTCVNSCSFPSLWHFGLWSLIEGMQFGWSESGPLRGMKRWQQMIDGFDGIFPLFEMSNLAWHFSYSCMTCIFSSFM